MIAWSVSSASRAMSAWDTVQESPTSVVLVVLKNVLLAEMVFPLVPFRTPAHASFRMLLLKDAPPPAGPPIDVQVLSR